MAKTAKASKASKVRPNGYDEYVDDKPKKLSKKLEIEVKDGDKKNLWSRFIGYFVGAWVELRQVRWPTRKATWGLTIAVILFSAFFVAVILLLDALFKYLFDFIIA